MIANGIEELFTGGEEGLPDPTEPKKVDNKLREDWNAFLEHLEKKGMRGKPDLDKGGKGYAELDEYIKANPTTSLSREKLPLIRSEFNNYRNWVLDQHKSGLPVLQEGVTPDNFMKFVVENEKTADPNYPGMNFTRIRFPKGYIDHFVNGQKVKRENLDFQVAPK